MDLSEAAYAAARLLQHLFLVVGIVSTIVGVEFVRYSLRRRRWLAEYGRFVDTSSVVVANQDGASRLETGLLVPAQRVGGEWQYRHKVGEQVLVLGYPSFQSWMTEPPVTVTVVGR